MDGMRHRYWNVVQNTDISTLLYREKSQTHADGPHGQSVVTRPDRDLHQIISAQDSSKTNRISLRLLNYYCDYVSSCI